MTEQPKFYCQICNTETNKIGPPDDVGTQFYKCEKGHQTTNPLTQEEKDKLEQASSNSKITEENKPQILEHINNIENPNLIGKPVIIEAVISSTSVSYVVPSKIKGILKEEDQDNATITSSIKIDDAVNISLVAVTEEAKNHRLTNYFKNKFPNGKIINRVEKEHRTVYMIRVRPPVFTLEKCGDKLIDEKGYEYKYLDLYIASDTPLTFQPSTLIRLTGLPLPNPRTQKTTLLSYIAEFPEDNLNYNIEKLQSLKNLFEQKNVSERFKWIIDNFELYSHIFGRANIAKAGILGYFSPLWVRFNGETQRGWLIIAIIGDTTTGKSETIKKLSKLFKAGSVISAETASTVGLTGAATQLEKEGWFVDWGFLPLMDRKLLAIDGSHKLGASAWAVLAEAERSGVLSIAKAAKNTTYARTRQIRIYNAVDLEADKYSTKSLSSFLYPIQALTTVLDKTSTARLDLAVFSDQRDVTPETINKKVTDTPSPLLENMAEVLKWAWSNNTKIEWTEKAVSTLLAESTGLYKKFFYEPIPIVSIDDKWKIARLSVALAYCTLSTNEDFSVVTVTEEHVKTIIEFLTEEYTKIGLGILAQEQTFEKLTVEDVKEILLKIQAHLYKNPITNLFDILAFIVKQNHTTNDELKTKFELVENNQARPLIAVLKTEGLLRSKRGYYPTPKLIEVYQVTDGFKIFNGDNAFNASRKDPPPSINGDKNLERTINQTDSKQQQLDIGGVNSETVKPVMSVKNDVSNTEQQLKVVTEESGLRRLEVNQDFEKSALEEIHYCRIPPNEPHKCQCPSCSGEGVREADFETVDSEGKPLFVCEGCLKALEPKVKASGMVLVEDLPDYPEEVS